MLTGPVCILTGCPESRFSGGRGSCQAYVSRLGRSLALPFRTASKYVRRALRGARLRQRPAGVVAGSFRPGARLCRRGVAAAGRPAQPACARLGLALSLFPTLIALRMGQISPLMLAGLVGFLYFLRHERGWLAGLALLPATVKPHLFHLVWLALTPATPVDGPGSPGAARSGARRWFYSRRDSIRTSRLRGIETDPCPGKPACRD